MSNRLRQILASCMGALLLFMLLLLASLNRNTRIKPPPKTVLHEVRMYQPPPEPPPPPVKQQVPQNTPTPSLIEAVNAEDPVKLDIMELEVDMEDIIISGLGTGGLGGGGGNGLGEGGEGWDYWGTVSLPELDRIPMVISALELEYPKEALDRNIREFTVKFHIIIDELGRTYPVRILENPFPSINKELLEFASEVRFTPPTKQGIPVKAEYLWPVLFQKK